MEEVRVTDEDRQVLASYGIDEPDPMRLLNYVEANLDDAICNSLLPFSITSATGVECGLDEISDEAFDELYEAYSRLVAASFRTVKEAYLASKPNEQQVVGGIETRLDERADVRARGHGGR